MGKSIVLTAPEADQSVSLWTDWQRNFALHEAARKRAATQDVFIDYLNLTPSKIDHSIPAPVKFEWETRGFTPSRSKLEVFEVGKKNELVPVLCRSCRNSHSDVYNLKAGCKYAWKVSAGRIESKLSYFSTALEIPRWLNIPGATNVRDLGGRKTRDGKMVKQNLLFRGSEFDRHQFIKKSGIKELINFIGLKTDLDIRGGTEIVPNHVPALPQDKVAWVNFQLRPYDMIFTDEQKERYAGVLKYLTVPEHFPAYFHCWGSADRGGTLSLLLHALLGVDESEMLADYEFTTCSIFAERRVGFKQFVNLLETLDSYDKDLQVAAEKYFMEGGATKRDIAAFRKIMLED